MEGVVDIAALEDLAGGPDTQDAVIRALGRPRVRYVLAYLQTHPSPPFERVVDAVTGLEAANTNELATLEDRQRIRTALFHVELPLLAELGFIERGPEDRQIVATSVPSAVSRALGFE